MHIRCFWFYCNVFDFLFENFWTNLFAGFLCLNRHVPVANCLISNLQLLFFSWIDISICVKFLERKNVDVYITKQCLWVGNAWRVNGLKHLPNWIACLVMLFIFVRLILFLPLNITYKVIVVSSFSNKIQACRAFALIQYCLMKKIHHLSEVKYRWCYCSYEKQVGDCFCKSLWL